MQDDIKKDLGIEFIEDNNLESVSGGKSLTETEKVGIGLGITLGVVAVLAISLGVAYGSKKNKVNELDESIEFTKKQLETQESSALTTTSNIDLVKKISKYNIEQALKRASKFSD